MKRTPVSQRVRTSLISSYMEDELIGPTFGLALNVLVACRTSPKFGQSLCNRPLFIFFTSVYFNLPFVSLCSLQKQCVEFCINAKPTDGFVPTNKNSVKYKVWKLVVSQPFEYLIMSLIALNTIALMMKVFISAVVDVTRKPTNHFVANY